MYTMHVCILSRKLHWEYFFSFLSSHIYFSPFGFHFYRLFSRKRLKTVCPRHFPYCSAVSAVALPTKQIHRQNFFFFSQCPLSFRFSPPNLQSPSLDSNRYSSNVSPEKKKNVCYCHHYQTVLKEKTSFWKVIFLCS